MLQGLPFENSSIQTTQYSMPLDGITENLFLHVKNMLIVIIVIWINKINLDLNYNILKLQAKIYFPTSQITQLNVTR